MLNGMTFRRSLPRLSDAEHPAAVRLRADWLAACASLTHSAHQPIAAPRMGASTMAVT